MGCSVACIVGCGVNSCDGALLSTSFVVGEVERWLGEIEVANVGVAVVTVTVGNKVGETFGA